MLKGFDKLLNLVLDDAVELMRGERACAGRPNVVPGSAPSCPSPPVPQHRPLPPPVAPCAADPEDTDCTTSASRPLGIMVCRGPSVMAVAPNDGYDAIANPFEDAEEDEEEGDAE